MNDRIAYIDGLRGIAILGVIFFHAYSRWGGIEPYDQNQFLVEFFSKGWLGVQLFFAISGYVIYMSILRCENVLMFATARYLRLAPAMLVAALLIYITSFLIPERPLGYSNLIDFLPSITFIDPGLLSKLTGLEIRSLEGAFWSLYVEVKFYFVAAIAYFLLKDNSLKFLVTLYVLWLLLAAVKYFQFESDFLATSLKILNYAGVKYYGWFLLGIFSYKFTHNKSFPNSILLLGIAFVAAITTKFGDFEVTIYACFTASLFLLPLALIQVRRLLANKLFLFFGYISYPLYLVHENSVTGLAIKLHSVFPYLPSYLYPLPFIILVIVISFLIAKIEPIIKKRIKIVTPKTLLGYRLLK
jgi:peptidoglycan/LPS O-acetylase OafA/YrhL